MQLLLHYSHYEIVSVKEKYYPARIKQWLKFMVKHYAEAEALFLQVRVMKKTPDILALLKSEAEH